MTPNTYVLNLFNNVREWFFPSFLRRFSDSSTYNDDTTKDVEDSKGSIRCLEIINSESQKDLDEDSSSDHLQIEDEELKANTRANSLTNVAQYSKISAVKVEEIPPNITSTKKGKSSLAIAAAASSIMFSMPASHVS
jgi:hypothetical protein